MGALIGAIIARTGWSERIARIAAGTLLFALALLILGLGKCAYDRALIAKHDAKQEAAVQKKLQPANDHASEARANDAIAIQAQEKEAHDAIHSVPDAAPAAPSVRLGCDRLRRAGQDLARIPACAGPSGGG